MKEKTTKVVTTTPSESTVATQKVSVESLLTQAIDKNVPVETMERLLAMREKVNAEYAKEEFNRAMAAFQGECPTIEKTKEVKTKSGVVAYKYAPIESIVDQVKDLLKKHGFSYSSNMELSDNGVRVLIKVTHAAGHSEISEMTVPLGNKTEIMSQTQVVAAAQTFAKRYAFCNAFGILTGDEDTDARPQETEVKSVPAKTKIAHLASILGMKKENILEEVKTLTGLELVEENYDEIITRLESVVKAEKNNK